MTAGDRLLALDFGTTRIKAAILTPALELEQIESVESPTRRPREGWAEQDGEELWKVACSLTRQLVNGTTIAAVVVTSVGEAGLLVDDHGTPLTPALAWFDRRTDEQAQWWEEAAGKERVYAITGMVLDGSYGANKLLWLREHSSRAFADARHWLSIADFIDLQLTGTAATVPSLASRTMLYDQHTRDWSCELLELAGIRRDLMPPIVESGTLVGEITTEAAKATGIAKGTPVVAGGHDHLCSALALRGGTDRTVDSTGTAEVVVTPVDTPLTQSLSDAGFIACYADAEPERYVCSARVGLAGALVEWARRELFEGASYDNLLSELEQTQRPSGLICLPTFGRPASPFFNIDTAVGAVVGLTLNHSRAELLLGLLEATCFSLRANIEQVELLTGTDVTYVTVGGGAVQNPLWLQLKADITGRVIERGASEESALVGAATLAGAAIDAYESAAEASRTAWRRTARYEPSADVATAYEELYETYRELIPAIAPTAQAVKAHQGDRHLR